MALFEQFVALVIIGLVMWQIIIPIVLGFEPLPLFRRKKKQTYLVTKQAEAADRPAILVGDPPERE